MGNLQAAGYAQMVSEGVCDLPTALRAHLSSNHWPAIPLDYVAPLIEAITAVDEDEPLRDIDITAACGTVIPNLAVKRDFHWLIPAATLVDICNAWGFTQQDDEEEW